MADEQENVELLQALIDTYPDLKDEFRLVKVGSVPPWMVYEKGDYTIHTDGTKWFENLYRLDDEYGSERQAQDSSRDVDLHCTQPGCENVWHLPYIGNGKVSIVDPSGEDWTAPPVRCAEHSEPKP